MGCRQAGGGEAAGAAAPTPQNSRQTGEPWSCAAHSSGRHQGGDQHADRRGGRHGDRPTPPGGIRAGTSKQIGAGADLGTGPLRRAASGRGPARRPARGPAWGPAHSAGRHRGGDQHADRRGAGLGTGTGMGPARRPASGRGPARRPARGPAWGPAPGWDRRDGRHRAGIGPARGQGDRRGDQCGGRRGEWLRWWGRWFSWWGRMPPGQMGGLGRRVNTRRRRLPLGRWLRSC
jgi:hypothetical protein